MGNNKVYLIVDELGYIKGYTTTKFTDKEGQLLEGYLEMEGVDEIILGNYLHYKVENGKLVKMDEVEFEKLFPISQPNPSPTEVLQHENHLLKAQVNALTEEGEFQSDLIAELATIVYA